MKLANVFRLSVAVSSGKKMSNHLVFVYGTLKNGQPNHNWLTSRENGFSKFISPAQTLKKYPLVIASRYNIPFLLDSPGNGENVIGEVYEVDDKMLSNLDILEDHPTFYVREVEKVTPIGSNSDGQAMDCWIYFLKKFKPQLLAEKCLREYSSYGDHGKPYSTKELRDPGYHAKSDVLTGES